MTKKIKAGEYIRTKTGNIDKVIYVRDAEEDKKKYPDNPYKRYWRDKYHLERADYLVTNMGIMKHSKKLTDLIEVGDYVNGEKVDETTDGKLGITPIDEFIPIEKVKIKDIVTLEQFEKIKYEVRKR